ncbi:SDR family NAD(P)-dependent oxidoreductase, partial [Paenibacillus sp. MCAF20]
MSVLLKDKVAVITGAGSGIGRAAALHLARNGANICLFDLNNNRTEEAEQAIHDMGGQSLFVDVDVSDPQRVQQAVQAVIERFGRIDIVFANAGINGTLAPIEDLTPEAWDETLSTNLKGTFLTVKYA